MPFTYNTFQQLLDAHSSEPFFYAKISGQYYGVTSLIMSEAGATPRTAVNRGVNAFGDVAEHMAETLEPTTVTLTLDGLLFSADLVAEPIEIYFGATTLPISEHQLIWSGEISAESKQNRAKGITAQDSIYLALLRSVPPNYRIIDIEPTAPSDTAQNWLPAVFGSLLQINGSKGRLQCWPLTSVVAGSNDFAVCQHEFGEPFLIDRVYKNGILLAATDWTSAEVAGTPDYIKITIASSTYTDVIAVEMTRRTTEPFTELRAFLETYCGIATASLDTASFVTAQATAAERNYTLGGMVIQPDRADNIVNDWLNCFSARGVFSAGKFGVYCPNYDIDWTAKDFSEGNNILRNSLSVQKDFDQVYNQVNYATGLDYFNNRRLANIAQDAASIAVYGLRSRDFVYGWCGDSATAQDAASRWVDRHKEPRGLITLDSFLTGLNAEIAGNIRVTGEGLARAFIEVNRRILTMDSGRVRIEGEDVDSMTSEAFRLGAAEDRTTPVDSRNCSVADSVNEASDASLTTGGDQVDFDLAVDLTATGLGVKVGDHITLTRYAVVDEIARNAGTYSIYEAGKVVGDYITTASHCHVKDANTGAAVTFLSATGGGDEVVTKWYIARSWATADADQRRMGFLCNNAGVYSDGSPGKQLK